MRNIPSIYRRMGSQLSAVLRVLVLEVIVVLVIISFWFWDPIHTVEHEHFLGEEWESYTFENDVH